MLFRSLRDVLPRETNISKLIQIMKDGPTSDKLAQFIKSNNKDDARSWLSNENNYASALKYILNSKTLMEWFVPLLSKEKIASLISSHEKTCKYVMNNMNLPIFAEICKDILEAKTDNQMTSKIRKFLTQHPEMSEVLYK